MDVIKIIEKLAKTAQNEPIQQFDVSDSIMAQINLLQQEKVGLLPFELFAGITAAAASIVVFFSIQAWQYIVNPLYQLFAPYQGVSLW